MFIAKNLIDNIIYWFYEKPKGLDFARNSYPYNNDSDNVWYERTTKKHIRQMFSVFRDKNAPVIDLGCGKGYLLYRLSHMGFSHVDGIEYNADIAAIARSNLKKLKLNKKVRVARIDAGDFEGFDEYRIIYMFHPFKENVMKRVLQHIEESIERRPRKVTVVYFYPVLYYMWDRSPYFARTKIMTLFFTNNMLEVFYYEYDPAWQGVKPNSKFQELLEKEIDRAARTDSKRGGAESGES